MLERFTDPARQAVIAAKTKAAERGDAQVGALHLLSALTTGDSAASGALAALGVGTAAVDRELGPAHGPVQPDDPGDAEALRAIGIDLDEIKRRVEETFGEGALTRVPLTPRGPLNWIGRTPFTDEAKRVLAESVHEARDMRHNYIGTEHLLLGLLRTGEIHPRGNLAQALRTLRLGYPATRRAVLDQLGRASA
jgi:ATP-dependent Clp protease ATP-binding subunit ClpA